MRERQKRTLPCLGPQGEATRLPLIVPLLRPLLVPLLRPLLRQPHYAHLFLMLRLACWALSAYASICQHTPGYVRIRQHTSAHASIRRHT